MEDENKKIILHHDENKHENGHITLNDQREQECCEPVEME